MFRCCLLAFAVSTLIGASSPIPAVVRSKFSLILKDPGSTQYQLTNRPAGKICGRYNSKNSYGGYVGFEEFVFLTETGRLYTVDTEVLSNGAVLNSRSMIRDDMSDSELLAAQQMGLQLFDRIRSAFVGCS